MKIIVENSIWTNVGNGWFQMSLYMMIKQMYPEHNVIMGEGPISLAFRLTNEKQIKNSFNIMDYEKADLHIFSGPILSLSPKTNDYSSKFMEIINRGANYMLISISGTALSNLHKIEWGEFLQKYPPLFFSSRDEETYNTFKSIVKNIYNGICTSFIVDKVLSIEKIKLEKSFFISSFYTELEPYFTIKKDLTVNIENIELKRRKTVLGLPYRYSRHLNFLSQQQNELSGYSIVRTIQDLNTKFNHINFALPNSFISFNPDRYLELTKSAEFVISDRVHACAISLAFNHPARFLFNTPRAGIFDRVGFKINKTNGIIYPNMEKIENEFENLKREIKKNI